MNVYEMARDVADSIRSFAVTEGRELADVVEGLRDADRKQNGGVSEIVEVLLPEMWDEDTEMLLEHPEVRVITREVYRLLDGMVK